MTNPKGAIPISFVTAHDRAVRPTLSAILGSAFACNKSCRVLRHTLAGLQNKNQKCHHSFTQIMPMHATWLQWIATKLKLNFLIRNVCVKGIRFGDEHHQSRTQNRIPEYIRHVCNWLKDRKTAYVLIPRSHYASEIWKRRFHSQFVNGTISGHFWFSPWEKLGQGKHTASSFSKISSIHIETALTNN